VLRWNAFSRRLTVELLQLLEAVWGDITYITWRVLLGAWQAAHRRQRLLNSL